MILVETAAGPSKAALRAWVRARRSERSSLDRERASTAIARPASSGTPSEPYGPSMRDSSVSGAGGGTSRKNT